MEDREKGTERERERVGEKVDTMIYCLYKKKRGFSL